MGILSSIKEKLFGKSDASTAAKTTTTASNTTAATTGSSVTVDVEAAMEAAVQAKGIKLNWRTSIVDLLKALDLDSSLAARKELAADLKYDGTDPDGSAEKNIWLHKAVMKILAENGGKLPKGMLK